MATFVNSRPLKKPPGAKQPLVQVGQVDDVGGAARGFGEGVPSLYSLVARGGPTYASLEPMPAFFSVFPVVVGRTPWEQPPGAKHPALQFGQDSLASPGPGSRIPESRGRRSSRPVGRGGEAYDPRTSVKYPTVGVGKERPSLSEVMFRALALASALGGMEIPVGVGGGERQCGTCPPAEVRMSFVRRWVGRAKVSG